MCDKLMLQSNLPLTTTLGIEQNDSWKKVAIMEGRGVIIHLFCGGRGSAPLLLLKSTFCGI